MPTIAAEPSARPSTVGDFTTLPLRRRATWVIMLGSLTAVGALTIDLYLPAFPDIERQLHASNAAVQLTLTGMLLGLMAGQLVVGPLADALGRRRPLLVGLGVHVVASLACMLAPTIEVLAITRVCQGFGVAACSVTAMAVVRDRFRGHGAALLIARLMLIVGVSPILAPTVGTGLLAVTSWRGIFAVLAGVSLAVTLVVAKVLPETHPPAARRALSFTSVGAGYRQVLADAPTRWLILVAALSSAAVFAYASGSSFVFQQQYHLSGRQYGAIFAAGGFFLISGSQIAGSLVRRVGPRRLLLISLCSGTTVATALLVVGSTGWFGLPVILVLICGITFSFGIGQPTPATMALARHRGVAATTAALLGASQFGMGAISAPLVSAFGVSALTGMAIVITSGFALALLIYVTRARPGLSNELPD